MNNIPYYYVVVIKTEPGVRFEFFKANNKTQIAKHMEQRMIEEFIILDPADKPTGGKDSEYTNVTEKS